MKTQSAKAKGRRFQQWVRDQLIECKNQESLNVWKSYEQAEANSGDYESVVFIKRNNQKPLVVVDAEYFIKLHKMLPKEYSLDELVD